MCRWWSTVLELPLWVSFLAVWLIAWDGCSFEIPMKNCRNFTVNMLHLLIDDAQLDAYIRIWHLDKYQTHWINIRPLHLVWHFMNLGLEAVVLLSHRKWASLSSSFQIKNFNYIVTRISLRNESNTLTQSEDKESWNRLFKKSKRVILRVF